MPLSPDQRLAMALALNRAASRLEEEALELEALLERRRKPHHGDDSAVIAQTLRRVVRQLRGWAKTCSPGPGSGG